MRYSIVEIDRRGEVTGAAAYYAGDEPFKTLEEMRSKHPQKLLAVACHDTEGFCFSEGSNWYPQNALPIYVLCLVAQKELNQSATHEGMENTETLRAARNALHRLSIV